MTTNLSTKPVGLSQRSPIGSYSIYMHCRHLLLLSSKADTHFTIPWRVEGWVELSGWLHTEMVYLSAETVTHPSNNQAHRRVTSLIETIPPPILSCSYLKQIHGVYLSICMYLVAKTQCICVVAGWQFLYLVARSRCWRRSLMARRPSTLWCRSGRSGSCGRSLRNSQLIILCWLDWESLTLSSRKNHISRSQSVSQSWHVYTRGLHRDRISVPSPPVPAD